MAKKKSKDKETTKKKKKSTNKKELEDSLKSSELEDTQLHKFLKGLVSVLLFPFIFGLINSFIHSLAHLDLSLVKSFYWGVAVYLLVHLFLFEPLDFYKHTQKAVQYVFGFLAPLCRISYYLMPFWILVLWGLYFLIVKVIGNVEMMPMFYFATSFIFVMHLVLVAAILRTEDIKGLLDYLFVLFIVVVINVFLAAITLKIFKADISLVALAKGGVYGAQTMFQALSSQVSAIFN